MAKLLDTKTCYTCFFIFILSFGFAYLYCFLRRENISAYVTCFTGGIILSTMIFHIFPHMYEKKGSFLSPFSSGLTLLVLLAVDKVFSINDDNSLSDNTTKLEAFVFVVALSLHSFLEGLGVPAKSERELRWYLFGLIGHKWIEAFALGVMVLRAPFSALIHFTLIFVYSILTPLGIIFGIYLFHVFSETNGLLEALLTGISAGSFFYIGFVEMINSKYMDNHKDITDMEYKLLCLFAGFVIMGVVNYFCESIGRKGSRNESSALNGI